MLRRVASKGNLKSWMTFSASTTRNLGTRPMWTGVRTGTCSGGESATCTSPSNGRQGGTFVGLFSCIVAVGTVASSVGSGNRQQRDTSQCQKKGTSSSIPIDKTYTIGEILGEGGYGKVYKAKRKSDGEVVALKTMNQKNTNKEEFERETKTLSALSANGGHAHVCKLYGIHNDDENFYLAMELIEGGELFDHLIRNGAYSEEDASKFLKQHGEALAYIHSHSFIHADIKPENLMLSSFDERKAQLKIVDFGCTLSTNEPSNNHPDIMGTPAYWPPELFSKKRTISPAMDMFATGIIMYILLTGTHPFDPMGDATDEEIEGKIRNLANDDGCNHLEATVMDQRTDHLTDDAKDLIRKLMQSDPLLRITSQEFLFHSWVHGSTASHTIITDSDQKLKHFWQKRFKAAILKKYAKATTGGKGTLSDSNLREIFGAIDTDGDHTLDANEVKAALLGMLMLRSNEDSSDLFRSIDLDGDGRIDFEEFKNILRQSFDDGPGIRTHSNNERFRSAVLQRFPLDGANTLSDEQLQQMFVAMDLDGDHVLQINELVAVLGRCKGKDKEQLSEWVDSIDTNLSGGVDFEEFKKAMRNQFE